MGRPGENVPLPGSYRSVLALILGTPPPATRTLPLESNTAAELKRIADMLPTEENVPALGSYSSALVK